MVLINLKYRMSFLQWSEMETQTFSVKEKLRAVGSWEFYFRNT